jgi:hypothetical protein
VGRGVDGGVERVLNMANAVAVACVAVAMGSMGAIYDGKSDGSSSGGRWGQGWAVA